MLTTLLNNQDNTDLKAFTTYPEYQAFEKLLTAYLIDLKDVSNIDESKADIGQQALARKYAHKMLTDFLASIQVLTSQNTTPSKKTYE